MADTSYTLADLESAREALAAWKGQYARYSGNNPDKYRSEMRAATREVRRIERALKSSGIMPLTEHELLEHELDEAFPEARSKQVVEHKGRRYERWFCPAEESNSGKTVHEWDKGWTPLTY